MMEGNDKGSGLGKLVIDQAARIADLERENAGLAAAVANLQDAHASCRWRLQRCEEKLKAALAAKLHHAPAHGAPPTGLNGHANGLKPPDLDLNLGHGG